MSNYKKIEAIKENHRSDLQDPESDWPMKVREALNCKQNNLYERLTVEWVKDTCHITSKNFSSRFAHYVGKTPKQYINHHRIEVAKQLLAEEELESVLISTIAFEVGFANTSTFSKCFKRKTGMPPTQWRDRNRNR